MKFSVVKYTVILSLWLIKSFPEDEWELHLLLTLTVGGGE
jgi:hypothetical protein